MLVMVADSNIVKAASEDPPLPDGTDGDNETAPPPEVYPAPPMEDPQRPVEPGTVTQGWDDSRFAPTPFLEPADVSLKTSETEVRYDTAYGDFVLNRSSPYFIQVFERHGTAKIADSA